MEMVDVLQKLKEITNKSPEVAKAIKSVESTTNPKTEVAPPGREKQVKALKGKVDNPYAVAWSSYNKSKGKKESIKEGGMSDVHIGAQEKVGEYVDQDGNLSAPKQDVLQSLEQQRASAPFPESYEIETAIKMVQDDFDDNGQAKAEYEPDPEDNIPHDVDTQMNMDAPAEEQPIKEAPNPKREAIQTLEALRDMVMELPISDDAKTSAHTALDQVSDDIMMDTATDEEATAEEPKIEEDTLNINGMTTEEDVISMIQDTISAGKGDDAKDYLEQFKQYLFVKSGGRAESKELNTETMKKEDKKPLKEAITMSADTPQEAGMLMQILKLAGVQQVTPDMIGAEEPTADVPTNDADHDHNNDGEQDHAPQDCNVCSGDDAIGSQGMGNMRDIISKNDNDEQAEETWDNAPDEKVDDLDTLVNVHSGGLNKQKQQVRKEYPGDNPLAAEDKISEEDLANSLRTQYEGFKKSYQEATKVAETKAEPKEEEEVKKEAVADKK